MGSNHRWVITAGWKQYLLNTVKVEKKKKEESTHCPVFLLFFFIYTMEKPTMEISWENMREPSRWEWYRCVGEVFLFLPGLSPTLSAGPAAG